MQEIDGVYTGSLGAGQMAKDKYLRLWVHEVRGCGLVG